VEKFRERAGKKMNPTIETIYQRRAVRKFKDMPVDRKLIEQLLDAGRMAPSAINKQPWKFYILTDKELIKEFSKETAKAAAKGMLKTGVKGLVKSALSSLSSFHLSDAVDFFKGEDPIFHGAPVVVFIAAPKDNEWAGLDIGMCSQNIMLAAKSIGLDSCPVGMGKFVENTSLFPKLHVPDTEHILLSIIIGYGDDTPEVHERVKNNVVFI
jgi:nitroreductase